MQDVNTARRAFLRHRRSADKRCIPFRLTYEEWWSVWAPHWNSRASLDLDMCRTNDQGAYELGNVRIDTHAANMNECWQTTKQKAEAKRMPHCRLGMTRPSLPERLARLEQRALRIAMRRAEGNMTNAAYRLGISFRQFRYLCKRHKVTRSDYF